MVRAYERCWFFGDSFASRSFEQYFQNRKAADYNGYTKANFDTSGFFNNFTSDNPSVTGRLSILLAIAAKCQLAGKLVPLPKLIIVVPDDDLIKQLCKSDNVKGFSKPQSRLLNFIMTHHERCIAAFKETLPAKSIRSTHLSILWIQAPEHINFINNRLRYKFDKCLEEVTSLHSNVYTLQLKKVWNQDDQTLFLQDSQRFTALGYKNYWEAVDRTVRYFDSIVLKKQTKDVQKKFGGQKGKIFGQKDRFRWQNPSLNTASDGTSHHFRLPLLPCHC